MQQCGVSTGGRDEARARRLMRENAEWIRKADFQRLNIESNADKIEKLSDAMDLVADRSGDVKELAERASKLKLDADSFVRQARGYS